MSALHGPSAKYFTKLTALADKVEPRPAPVLPPKVKRQFKTKKGKLTPIIHTARKTAAEKIRLAAINPEPLTRGLIDSWDGVAKMSPDPSSVHVMGALGGPNRTKVAGERRRRGTFKRVIGA